MTSHFRPSLFALILLCLAPSVGLGQQPIGSITVGVSTAGWSPFVIAEGQGQLSGIVLDIVMAAAGSSGYTVSVIQVPQKRVFELLSSGDVDAVIKAREWVKNPDDFLWSDPLLELSDVLVFNRSNPIDFKTVHDLEGKTLGVVHGYVYPTLAQSFEDMTIHKHQNYYIEALLHMVLERRIDAAVCNKYVALWHFANSPNLPEKRFGFSANSIDSARVRLGITKNEDRQIFLERFNAELARMQSDGRLDTILNRYR